MDKKIILNLTIAAAVATIIFPGTNGDLYSGVLAAVSATDVGLKVTNIAVPYGDRRDSRIEENIGSLQNEASSNFKNRHAFTLNGNNFEAVLCNSSVLFIQEDVTQTIYHSSHPYPGGCRATDLLPSHDNSILFVAFEECPPLRIVVSVLDSNGLFQNSQPYSSLEGKKTIIVNGNDIYKEMTAHYIFVTEDGGIAIMSTNDGSQILLRPTQIDSCLAVSHIYPLTSKSKDGTIAFMVDCEASGGTKKRYVVKYDAYDDIVVSTRIGEPKGIPIASENGDYITVVVSSDDDDTHYLLLYMVDDLLITPVRINSDTPIRAVFLVSANTTWLVVDKNGENVELIDVSLFLSTRSEGRLEVMDTNTETYILSVSEDGFVMASVWNSDTQLFDCVIYRIEGDTMTISQTVPEISSQPAIFSFLRSDPPIVAATTTTTTTEMPLTTDGRDPTSPSQRGHKVLSIVLPLLSSIVVVFLIIVSCVVVQRVYIHHKKSSSEKTVVAMPNVVLHRNFGEMVSPTILTPSTHHAQETEHTTIIVTSPSINNILPTTSVQLLHQQETDEGYNTSPPSRSHSHRSSPVSERHAVQSTNLLIPNDLRNVSWNTF